MRGGGCSVWGWDFYCYPHHTAVKSLWLLHSNICGNRAASHSGSQTISLSKRHPAILYPTETQQSQQLPLLQTHQLPSPHLADLQKGTVFPFWYVCVITGNSKRERWRRNRPRVVLGYTANMDLFHHLRRFRQGSQMKGPMSGLWIHEEMAGIVFLGQQALLQITPLEPRLWMVWGSIP